MSESIFYPDQPLVTVIVPVYNDQAYIATCLDSILKQTYTYLQILVIDDGSTDETPHIIDQYALKHKRIEAIHIPNQGVSVARNTGLDKMNGDYVMFVDSDDYLDSHAIAHLVDYADTNELDIVLFGATYYHQDGSVEQYLPYPSTQILDEGEVKKRMYRGDLSTPIWDKFYSQSIWEDLRFDTQWLRGQDFVIQHQYFYRAHSIGCLAEPLYHYELRHSRGNFSLAYHLKFQYDVIRERLAFVETHDTDYIISVEEKLVRLALNIWHVSCVHHDEILQPLLPEIHAFLRQSLHQPVYKSCNTKRKMMLKLHRYAPTLYALLLKVAFRYIEPRQYTMLKES